MCVCGVSSCASVWCASVCVFLCPVCVRGFRCRGRELWCVSATEVRPENASVNVCASAHMRMAFLCVCVCPVCVCVCVRARVVCLVKQ